MKFRSVAKAPFLGWYTILGETFHDMFPAETFTWITSWHLTYSAAERRIKRTPRQKSDGTP